MDSTQASSSYGFKKIKLTIIPPKQLFIDLTNDDENLTTPSPTTTSSSPTPPNAPSKTPSTNETSSSQEKTSSSFQLKHKISPPSSNEPTSPQPLNPLLDLQTINHFKVICLWISLSHCHHLKTLKLHLHHLHHNLNHLSWAILFTTTIMTTMGQHAYVVLITEIFS
ncbi:hypothetical protein Tco_0687459 [Tanacetum coccineum]